MKKKYILIIIVVLLICSLIQLKISTWYSIPERKVEFLDKTGNEIAYIDETKENIYDVEYVEELDSRHLFKANVIGYIVHFNYNEDDIIYHCDVSEDEINEHNNTLSGEPINYKNYLYSYDSNSYGNSYVTNSHIILGNYSYYISCSILKEDYKDIDTEKGINYTTNLVIKLSEELIDDYIERQK